jgi:hypothetical protein
MRHHCLSAFLRVFLVLPLVVYVEQGAAAQNGEKADSKDGTKPARLKVAENWKVLGDIKSGLQPRPPFEVQKDEQTEFVREFVRLQWRSNDPIDLWVMRPKTPVKVPVVLYLYSYPEDTDRFRDNAWCERVTQGGFAAVGFVSALTGQRYHNRPMKEWFVSELEESLGSSVHDVQLILNYLADRGDMEFLKSVETLDPVSYLPHLKTLSIRLQQTLTEPVTPKSAKERIATSVPDPSQVAKYANAEEHLKAWQVSGLSGWIKQQLHLQNQATIEIEGRQP